MGIGFDISSKISFIVLAWSSVCVKVKLFLNSSSFFIFSRKLNHFFSFLFAYISINSCAISVASCFAFCIFFSQTLQPSPVNFGFSTHKYLFTLETSVIGTNNLSSPEYSISIYSLITVLLPLPQGRGLG